MSRRVVRAIAAITAAALLLFGLPLAIAVKRVYRDEELIRLQREAAAATQAVGETVGGGDPAELRAVPGVSLALYGPAGRRLSGAGPARADGPTTGALAGHVAEASPSGRLVVAVPVARRERVLGAVRAERSAAVVGRRVRRARLLMLVIALAVFALAVGVAVLVARRLARPVGALADAVGRLGDGDFVARAPQSGIAELDAAGRALDATARRLGDLVDRERAFSVDASHQLRTPLTALRLDLEAGRTEDALAHADRLDGTIATLLAAARDDDRPAAQRVDLDAELAALRDAWHARLAAAGRPLRLSADAGLPPVAAAPGAVRQVLQVLLDNAERHGGGAVTVRARRAGDAVAVDVRDEGPGVPGDVEAVFTRRGAAAAGTGVGLSLARSLATADGGRLVLQRAGPEPTFTLLLPAAPAG